MYAAAEELPVAFTFEVGSASIVAPLSFATSPTTPVPSTSTSLLFVTFDEPSATIPIDFVKPVPVIFPLLVMELEAPVPFAYNPIDSVAPVKVIVADVSKFLGLIV